MALLGVRAYKVGDHYDVEAHVGSTAAMLEADVEANALPAQLSRVGWSLREDLKGRFGEALNRAVLIWSHHLGSPRNGDGGVAGDATWTAEYPKFSAP